MYICLDCGLLFESPKHYTETHGLEYPPYEEWDGCPKCSGAYVEAHICDGCDEYIVDDYILTRDEHRYCEKCFADMQLGDE